MLMREQLKEVMIDGQIKNLPRCANEECKEEGRILLAGGFYCGKCILAYEDMKNRSLGKMITEERKKND